MPRRDAEQDQRDGEGGEQVQLDRMVQLLDHIRAEADEFGRIEGGQGDEWALARFPGDKRALAERLGVSERTLYRKLQEVRGGGESDDAQERDE